MLDKPALFSLFADLSQIPQWIWNGDPQPFVQPQINYPEAVAAIGYIGLLNASVIGVDDSRQEYDTASELIEINSYGVREYTFSLRVESFSNDIETADLCEMIRTRLRRPSSRARLAEIGFSLKEILPITGMDYTQDNRRVYASGFDLICNRLVDGNEAAPARRPVAPERITWIENVDAGGPIPLVPSS